MPYTYYLKRRTTMATVLVILCRIRVIFMTSHGMWLVLVLLSSSYVDIPFSSFINYSVLTSATESVRSSMIPDSAGDVYPAYKSIRVTSSVKFSLLYLLLSNSEEKAWKIEWKILYQLLSLPPVISSVCIGVKI